MTDWIRKFRERCWALNPSSGKRCQRPFGHSGAHQDANYNTWPNQLANSLAAPAQEKK